MIVLKVCSKVGKYGHSLEVDVSCSIWTLLSLVSQGSHLEQWQVRMSLKTQFTVCVLWILSYVLVQVSVCLNTLRFLGDVTRLSAT